MKEETKLGLYFVCVTGLLATLENWIGVVVVIEWGGKSRLTAILCAAVIVLLDALFYPQKRLQSYEIMKKGIWYVWAAISVVAFIVAAYLFMLVFTHLPGSEWSNMGLSFFLGTAVYIVVIEGSLDKEARRLPDDKVM